jgi:uncharacterized protein with predicted RNA binding PUA domain
MQEHHVTEYQDGIQLVQKKIPAKPLPIDPLKKLRLTIDYFYGPGTSKVMPSRGVEFEFSKATGRVRRARFGGELLCTFLPNGGIAFSIAGARMLSKSKKFRESCVTVSDDARPFVAAGRSVFCKHVVNVGKNIVPTLDVGILGIGGEVIAVGKAVLSSRMIEQFKRGVSVKVRIGIASHGLRQQTNEKNAATNGGIDG